MSEQKIKPIVQRIESAELLNQEKLDHDQHYDLDGVTQKNAKVIIPSNFKIQSHFFKEFNKNESNNGAKDRTDSSSDQHR